MDRCVWKVSLNANMTTASSLIHYKYRPARHVTGEELVLFLEYTAAYLFTDEGKIAEGACQQLMFIGKIQWTLFSPCSFCKQNNSQ